MRRKTRGLLVVLLGVAVALGVLLGVAPSSALAGTSYGDYVPTASDDSGALEGKRVKFNNIEWYVIADDSTAANDGTVTLFAAENIVTSKFGDNNKYVMSDVRNLLDEMVRSGSFAGVADAMLSVNLDDVGVEDVRLYLLSREEAMDLPIEVRKVYMDGWWIRSPSSNTDRPDAAVFVFDQGNYTGLTEPSDRCGVRPACKLDLASVSFDSASKTFTVGSSPVDVDVDSVTLDPSDDQTIRAGGIVTLSATVLPDNATDKKVTWASSDVSVGLYTDESCATPVGDQATDALTVYARGESAGAATVTCASSADPTKSATCKVTVKERDPDAWYVGDTFELGDGVWLYWDNDDKVTNPPKCKSRYTQTTVQAFTWYDTWNFWEGPTISVYGYEDYQGWNDLSHERTLYFGMPSGKTVSDVPVGFKIASGTGVEEDPYRLTLVYDEEPAVPVDSVTISPDGYQIVQAGKSIALTATVSPDDATDKFVYWDQSAQNVTICYDRDCTQRVGTDATDALTVYVMGYDPGMVTVTCKSRSDPTKSASVEVEVVNPHPSPEPTPATVTQAPKGRSLTYSGKAQALVTAGKAEGGEMQYSLDGNSWSAKVPTATNAGSYTVRYRVKGDASHTDVAAKSVKSTIAKARLTSIAKVADQAWTGKAVTPKPAVKGGSKALKAGTDFTYGYKDNTKAGTATVTATGKGNYAGTVKTTFKIVAATTTGRAHLQGSGWQPVKSDPDLYGTTGKSLRMEALSLSLPKGFPVKGSIQYRSHLQGKGWESGWKKDGAVSGTIGESRRIEAVQIKLTGEVAKKYDVYYRVHAQNYGWMGWARNGARAGTEGMSKRAEAVQVVLVPKGGKAPGATYRGQTRGYAKAYVAK